MSDAQAADDGVYSVAISNAAGATNSSLARVRVVPAPPAIAMNPLSLTVLAGTNVTFSVAATGSAPLSYQWYFDTRALAGATTAQCYVVEPKEDPRGVGARVSSRLRQIGFQVAEIKPGATPREMQGTGFVITPAGHILTCAHLVGTLTNATTWIGGQRIPARY